MDFMRKDKKKTTGSWTNVYNTKKCKQCEHKKEGIKSKKYVYRYIKINPEMKKIRLRMKTKEGIEKYNKRFHKGEISQAHILHNLEYRQFKCRGIISCENEKDLFSAMYNMRKIYSKWKDGGRNLRVSIKKYFLFPFGSIPRCSATDQMGRQKIPVAKQKNSLIPLKLAPNERERMWDSEFLGIFFI